MSDSSTMSTSVENETYLSVVPIVKLFLVFLLRAGSLIVQLGTFPTDNIYNIISQNIIDIAVTVTSFMFIGLPLYSNINNFDSFFAYGTWIGSEDVSIETEVNGVCACLIGTHIITSLLSGRLHTKASFLLYSIYSGVILPMTMHWVWNERGWMKCNNVFNVSVSFIDNNGGVLIHCASGVSAIIGSLFLGRRLLRLKDLDESSLAIGSSGLTIVGYFFIFFGITGMSLPNKNMDDIFTVIINNTFALCLGIWTVFALIRTERTSNWQMMQCFQGGIGAIVMISSSVGHYIIFKALVIVILSAIIFTVMVKLISTSPIEDYGNIISIHVLNGFISALIPNLSSDIKYYMWQLFCSAVILIVHAVYFTLLFWIINMCGILRNENEKGNHIRSKNLVKYTKTAKCRRVFRVNGRSIILEPGRCRTELQDNASVSFDANISTVSEGVKSTITLCNERERERTDDSECQSVVHKLQDLIDESKAYKETCSVE